MGGGSSSNHMAESHPKTWAWLLGPYITKLLGCITSQMAEDICLEEEAISSQYTHSSRWMGAQPSCRPQAGWGSICKALRWDCGPPPVLMGGTLSLSPDGCSSHNTAMAVAALGGFLYALAQYPAANGEPQQATLSPPTATDFDSGGSVPAIPR